MEFRGKRSVLVVREHCRKHKTKILEKFSTTSSFAERIDEWGEVEIFDKRSVLVVREHCQQIERASVAIRMQNKKWGNILCYLIWSSGGYLLSQVVSNQVPSALRALTSVFGMVTGVSLLLLLPHFLITIIPQLSVFDQVFDILVQLGLKYYYSYTYCLSTLWSSRCLT